MEEQMKPAHVQSPEYHGNRNLSGSCPSQIATHRQQEQQGREDAQHPGQCATEDCLPTGPHLPHRIEQGGYDAQIIERVAQAAQRPASLDLEFRQFAPDIPARMEQDF